MKNPVALVLLLISLRSSLFSVSAHAELSPENRAIFASAINAEIDPGVVACRQARDDGCIATYYAALTSTKAWRSAMPAREMFESTNLTAFDGLTAGKRDSWKLMMDNSPIDFTRAKMRSAVNDVWGATDRDVILNAATEFASRFEMLYGGNSATTGGVTAIKRNLIYPVNINDVSSALNP